jgi:hypothetical protein
VIRDPRPATRDSAKQIPLPYSTALWRSNVGARDDNRTRSCTCCKRVSRGVKPHAGGAPSNPPHFPGSELQEWQRKVTRQTQQMQIPPSPSG